MKKFFFLLGWIFIQVLVFGQDLTNADALKNFLRYSPEKAPLVSAHRGGPVKGYPENALETFALYTSGSPIIIETDIELTKDSALVMMHDNTLDRTTTGKGAVRDYTLSELKNLFLKDNFGNVTSYRIPTLEEVLKFGKSKGNVIYTLDVKRGVPYKMVIDEVRKSGAEGISVIITYNANQAEEVFKLAPDLMISVSLRSAADLERLKNLGIPESNMVAFVGTSEPDASLYELLHSKSIPTILGTMGNLDKQAEARGEAVYRNLYRRGADVLSTDNPAVALKAAAMVAEERKAGIFITDGDQIINPTRTNSGESKKKPYLILVSSDGFRHDYLKKYEAPFLKSMAEKYVTAESLIPSYPTMTFPNHYTLVTGMYPGHHGLVNNSFYDPGQNDFYAMYNREKVTDGKWYGGIPIWVLAEQQKMISANLFWVGSEAPVQGIQSTYWYAFNDKMEIEKRLQVVREWLNLPEDKRPHLITFYLSDVDHAGHSYGPDAVQTREAVKRVDSIMQALHEIVEESGLPVNFVFVSDHGMTAVDTAHPIPIPAVIDTSRFIIASMGTMVDIHARNKADIPEVYKQLRKEQKGYTTYLKTNLPKKYRYGRKDDYFNRVGDILLIPDTPYVVTNRKPNPGNHGYPNTIKDMHGIFIAWGPAFKEGVKLNSLENVSVFPLLAEVLQLPYTHKIDGKLKKVKKALK
jgi:predicted AlkP superfamily pyrophosphatase or phosphodiesterase/glycerophosphoryl diester phosphodiesterase